MQAKPTRDGEQHEDPQEFALRVEVPIDCTQCAALDQLLSVVRRALRSRPARLVLDLSRLRRMNCQLLSSVVFVARECFREGTALVLENIPAEFEAWVASHRLSDLMAQLGIACPAMASPATVPPQLRPEPMMRARRLELRRLPSDERRGRAVGSELDPLDRDRTRR